MVKAWRAPLQGCSLASAGIVNPLSEYEIIHQTLRISRWDPPLPVSLPTATLRSAPEGDHLGRLVNFSWSFSHSERLVSGEELSEGARGQGCCLHLRGDMLCRALPRGLRSTLLCGGGGGGSPGCDVNLYEDVHK